MKTLICELDQVIFPTVISNIITYIFIFITAGCSWGSRAQESLPIGWYVGCNDASIFGWRYQCHWCQLQTTYQIEKWHCINYTSITDHINVIVKCAFIWCQLHQDPIFTFVAWYCQFKFHWGLHWWIHSGIDLHIGKFFKNPYYIHISWQIIIIHSPEISPFWDDSSY